MGANKATRINPFIVNGKTVDIHITVRGSDWYWAVMSIMGTTLLVILGVSLLRPRTHRVFHHILAIVAVVATVMSFSLAGLPLMWSGTEVTQKLPVSIAKSGGSAIAAGMSENSNPFSKIKSPNKQTRFIIWPLLTLSLCLTAVMPLANTVWSCFLSAAMAVLALVGAMVRSDYKWGTFCRTLISAPSNH
jgi:bacteriorhodopsin